MKTHLSSAYPATHHPEIAERIAAIWAELFDDDELVVLPEDNFFVLGGSSLLAIRFLDRLNAEFSITLNLVSLVNAESLGDLACVVAEQLWVDHAEMEEGEL